MSDQHQISKPLEHLGLLPSELDSLPPARQILRVAEQGEGRGVPARGLCQRQGTGCSRGLPLSPDDARYRRRQTPTRTTTPAVAPPRRRVPEPHITTYWLLQATLRS